MNLLFPSKTDAIIASNHLIHPDAVLRRLRRLELIGVIRQHKGVWKVVPPPVDEPEPTSIVGQQKLSRRDDGKCANPGCNNLARKDGKFCSRACVNSSMVKNPRKPCLICGNITGNLKYCCSACRSKGIRKPLPRCRLCGNEVSTHERIYCSRVCHAESQRGNAPNMSGGRRGRKT